MLVDVGLVLTVCIFDNCHLTSINVYHISKDEIIQCNSVHAKSFQESSVID